MTENNIKYFKKGLKNIEYQIDITRDGNQWCALIGRDLQDGIAGFGDTITEALYDLSKRL